MPFANLKDLYGPLGLDPYVMGKKTLGERIATMEEAVKGIQEGQVRVELSFVHSVELVNNRINELFIDTTKAQAQLDVERELKSQTILAEIRNGHSKGSVSYKLLFPICTAFVGVILVLTEIIKSLIE